MVRGRGNRHCAVVRTSRISSETSRIGTVLLLAHVGLLPDGDGLYLLGLTKAKEYSLTGHPLSGLEAVEAWLTTPRAVARLEAELPKAERSASPRAR